MYKSTTDHFSGGPEKSNFFQQGADQLLKMWAQPTQILSTAGATAG